MYELNVVGTFWLSFLGLPLKALVGVEESCSLTCRANSRQVCFGVLDRVSRLSLRWARVIMRLRFARVGSA